LPEHAGKFHGKVRARAWINTPIRRVYSAAAAGFPHISALAADERRSADSTANSIGDVCRREIALKRAGMPNFWVVKLAKVCG
jgi:hypothetical protein